MNSFYPEILRCRLCGVEEKDTEFKDIFEENRELDLEKKIAKLLPVVVMAGDPLPHKICSPCVNKLIFFDDFYECTLKTEELLRTYFPSAPDIEIDNQNEVLRINNCSEVQKLLKLPRTKNPQTNEEKTVSPSQTPTESQVDVGKKLKRFIINPISKTASVFTCRQCFRTFIKESSALSHSCMNVEKCEKSRKIGEVKSKKSLPPLKIKLYHNISNKYVCNFCQKTSDKQQDMLKHVRKHLLCEETKDMICKKQKKKKKKIEGEEGEVEEENRNELRSAQNAKENSNENMLRIYSSRQNIPNKKNESPKRVFNQTNEDKQEIENQEPKITLSPGNYQNFGSTIPSKTLSSKNLEENLNTKEIYVINDDDDEVYKCFSCVFCDKLYTKSDVLLQHQQSHLNNSKSFTNHTIVEQ